MAIEKRYSEHLVAGAALRDDKGKFFSDKYAEKSEIPDVSVYRTAAAQDEIDSNFLTEHQDISGKYNKTGGEISGNVKIDGWLQMKIDDEDYNAGIQFTPALNNNLGTMLTLTGYAHGEEQTYYKTLLRNIATPQSNFDAVNKKYVDDKVNIKWIAGFDNGDGTAYLGSTAYEDAYDAITSNHMCFIKLTGTDGVHVMRLKDWRDYNSHSAGTDYFIFTEDTDEVYKRVIKLYSNRNEYLIIDYDDKFEHQTNKSTVINDTSASNAELFPNVAAAKAYTDALQTFVVNNYVKKPVLIYDGETDYLSTGNLVDGTYSSGAGLESQNQGEGTARDVSKWNIENADFSPYTYLTVTYRRNSIGAAAIASFKVPLNVSPITNESTGASWFVSGGSSMSFGDRNRSIVCGVGVSGDKTKFSVTQAFSLYGTAVTVINNIRVCKIEGHFD